MVSSVLGWLSLYATLTRAAQPSAPDPVEAPLRDLQFGDINFLHTTDTHGWHAGHLLEPSYSADWGDYIDFSDRLREKAEAAGQDLLVIDTGDRIEGNGLYDADIPRGLHTFAIFTHQHLDLICSGNHELYKQNSSEDEFYITMPAYHESYLASNLDILDKDGNFVPLGRRFKKFTTKVQGIRIMAFGFIFNFQRNDKNTKVTKVEDAIEQDWFKEAVRDREVDLFVVIGHAGIHSSEFKFVFDAIRSQNWDTPIQFFGGHFHVRDAAKFDSKAYGIASGRFMETVGFQSISGISTPNKTDVTPSSLSFFRRYINNNLYSYYHHTGLNATTFHSKKGRRVSRLIDDARKELKLDSVFGCAPKTYWMQRTPYPAADSIFTLLNDTVMPAIVEEPDRANKSRLILVNTGGIRFDIFKGPFSKDSTFIVSPFTSGMNYIGDVPFDLAIRLPRMMNSGEIPPISSSQDTMDADVGAKLLGPPEQYSKYFVDAGVSLSLSQNKQALYIAQSPFSEKGDSSKPNITAGYVTRDDLGNDGDDTIHTPIPYYAVPNVIQSLVIKPESLPQLDKTNQNQDPRVPETIDVIFNEFLQPDILAKLRMLKKDYTDDDVKPYMYGESMTDMIARWVSENWAQYCDEYDVEFVGDKAKQYGSVDDEL